MSEWRDISTAPKDGTWVLVAYPIYHHGNSSDVPDEMKVIIAHHDSLGWDTGVWRLHEPPRHWMPLPKPPA